jgi:hypothetical protein
LIGFLSSVRLTSVSLFGVLRETACSVSKPAQASASTSWTLELLNKTSNQLDFCTFIKLDADNRGFFTALLVNSPLQACWDLTQSNWTAYQTNRT